MSVKTYFYLRSGVLYARISKGQSKSTISTNIRLDKSKFLQKEQLSKDVEVNIKIADWLNRSKDVVSVRAMIDIINNPQDLIRLCDLIKMYNRSNPHLSLGSLEKYNAIHDIIKKYDNRIVDDIDNKYAIDFFNHCRTWMEQNSAINRLKQLKMFMQFAVDIDLIIKNPIIFAPKKEKKPIIYLTQEELNTLEKKDLNTRLDVIRDIFVFCCYTGMEYSRVFALKHDQIRNQDDRIYIESIRKKTKKHGKYANVRLLPVPLRLIDKYKGEEKIFPVKSNTKMNEYLKEIGAICDIEKVLHTHLARHTFATTVCLANGLSPASTSKQMGISIVRLMESYGEIINSRVMEETDEIFKKYSS